MKTLQYYWSKIIKKAPGSAIINSSFERPSKVEARCSVIDSSFGRYSYCGYGCKIINTEIGRFCSIADNVCIGLSDHPLDWVSTSPAFYKGKDSIPKDLAVLEHPVNKRRTFIGNDVWIGEGVKIKSGITIGNGVVFAMGSIVTRNVAPYSIVAGVPAVHKSFRFDKETRKQIEESKWWLYDRKELKAIAERMDDPNAFISALKRKKRK